MKMLKRILPNRGGRSLKLIKIPTTQLSKPEQDMEYDFDVSTTKGFTTASVPVTTASATPEVSTAAANLVYIRRSAEKRKDKGTKLTKGLLGMPENAKQFKKEFDREKTGTRCLKQSVDVGQSKEKNVSTQQYIMFPLWSSISSSYKSSDENDTANDSAENEATKQLDVVRKEFKAQCNMELFQGKATKASNTNSFNTVSTPVNAACASRTSNDAGSSSIPLFSKKRSREDSDKDNAKKQKLENDAKKKELIDSMDVVPRDDIDIDIESLATKYPIVDWKTHVLTENMMYYQIIRAEGSSKNYKIFSEMLDDFDRQDVLDLHTLVQERYDTTSPEGYDLLLWGDLKILFKPNEEDEIWKNQQDYNLISWRLSDSCGIHMFLMHT
ncbi:hypothetical protein Tco_0462130 [Tanacetum coccineum]